jgi:hypothetical protein
MLSDAGFIVGFSIIFLWLPIMGAFFAGLIGIRRAANQENAFYSALISALLMGILMYFLAPKLTGLPVQGAIARAGRLYLSMSFFIPLILGALLGYCRGK